MNPYLSIFNRSNEKIDLESEKSSSEILPSNESILNLFGKKPSEYNDELQSRSFASPSIEFNE